MCTLRCNAVGREGDRARLGSLAVGILKTSRWKMRHTHYSAASSRASSGATPSRPASAHAPRHAPRHAHLAPPQQCSQLRSTSSSTQQYAHHAAMQHTAQQHTTANMVAQQATSQPHHLNCPVIQRHRHSNTHQLISNQQLRRKPMQHTASAFACAPQCSACDTHCSPCML